MDTKTLDQYQLAITQVFQEWEALPAAGSVFRIIGVADRERNRYLLEHVESGGAQPIARTLAYLEISQGKIWVQVDNTETGIATQLVAAGIPKSQIVLGFYPPAMPERADLANHPDA